MKLLLIIVSVITVLAVDGRDFPGEYGGVDSEPGETESHNSVETDPETTFSIEGPISENEAHHFFSNKTGQIIPRKGGSQCKAKDMCFIMGGSCVTNATLCGGKLVPGCNGKNCQCCVPGTLETKINSLEEKLQTMQIKSLEHTLQTMKANLTNTNSKLNIVLQTLKDIITDANSKLSTELQNMQVNLTNANKDLNMEFKTFKDNLTKEFQSMSDNVNDSISNIESNLRRCPEGFFRTAGSNQCYKFYNDIKRSYPEAKGKCQKEGFVIAEPTNPLSLRKYMVETYATRTWAYVFLGARGTGSYLRWERSGRQISNSDSLWWNGKPGNLVSTSNCLVLLSEKGNMASAPYQPYHANSISDKFYTLCEYV